jgi:hypothetical protein
MHAAVMVDERDPGVVRAHCLSDSARRRHDHATARIIDAASTE